MFLRRILKSGIHPLEGTMCDCSFAWHLAHFPSELQIISLYPLAPPSIPRGLHCNYFIISRVYNHRHNFPFLSFFNIILPCCQSIWFCFIFIAPQLVFVRAKYIHPFFSFPLSVFPLFNMYVADLFRSIFPHKDSILKGYLIVIKKEKKTLLRFRLNINSYFTFTLLSQILYLQNSKEIILCCIIFN